VVASTELTTSARRAFRTRHPVLAFLGRRVALVVPVLLVISLLIFIGTQLLPGNTAQAILGRGASTQAVVALDKQLHLDRPLPERYLDWISDLLRGHLGDSVASQAGGPPQPISALIGPRILNTLVLAAITTFLLCLVSVPLGVVAARRPGKPVDHLISLATLGAISLPEFVVGTLLILIFANELGWFPGTAELAVGESPLSQPLQLVLPVLTLLAVTVAATARMIRAGMIKSLQSEYVEMARLNGYTEATIVVRYALPNALAPAVQSLAQNIGYLVGGIVVVEYLFNYPGLGAQLVEAVQARDVNYVADVALLLAGLYVLVNVLADLAVVFLVPKVRTEL
jgi:peptide/nickel transport system permease protein